MAPHVPRAHFRRLLPIAFIALLSAALSLAACSSAQKQFSRDLQAQRCEDAMVNLPANDPSIRFLGNAKRALGTVASYAFVGFSYTAEVLWDVTGGTIMAIGLCGPPILANSLVSGYIGPYEHLTCFPGDFNALASPPLGRQARKLTATMRCPDLSSLSQSVRSVASCYQARGGDDNFTKARQVLESLQKSDQFYSCLAPTEQDEIKRQLEKIPVAPVTSPGISSSS